MVQHQQMVLLHNSSRQLLTHNYNNNNTSLSLFLVCQTLELRNRNMQRQRPHLLPISNNSSSSGCRT